MDWQGEIVIQPFNKTHLLKVVNLHKTCFNKDNNLSMRLGNYFLQKTYDFFYLDPLSFGFVAIADDNVVGVITGRLDYYVDALNKYRRTAMIIGGIAHPEVFFNSKTLNAGLFILKALVFGKMVYKSNLLEYAPSHIAGGTATLASIAVHHDYTKHKVSDKLIESAVAYVTQKNKKILRCGITRSNMFSRFIFSKKGFIEDKVLSNNNDMYYFKKIQ